MKLEQQFVDFQDRLARLEAIVSHLTPPVPPSECEHVFPNVPNQPNFCLECGITKPTLSDEPTISISRKVVQDWMDDGNEDTWEAIDNELRRAIGKGEEQ
jgi:hypothetical protein